MKPTVALAALAGAGFGWGAWEAVARSLPEADEDRWTLRGASVPLEVPQLAGTLRADPGALDLWSYRGASPKIAPFAEGSISLTARVPVDGQLVVRLGAETVSGPEQPVSGGPVAPPPGQPGQPGQRPPGQPQPGSPPPHPPGAAPTLPGGQAPPAPRVGGPSRPKPVEQGVAVLIDRSARNAIVGRNLRCDAAAAPGETFTLGVEARRGELTVSIDGKPVTRCVGTWGPGAVVFGSGVRRVQVDDVRVGDFSDDLGGPLRSPLAGLVAALAGAALAARFYAHRWLALAPLVLLPWLGRLDLRHVLDGLRLLRFPEALGPMLFAGLPAAIALVLVEGAAAASLRGAILRGAVPLAGMLVGAALAGLPPDSPGWLALAALGVPLAALAWINRHPFRRRVATSYALTALVLAGMEGGVRLTTLNSAWTRTAGWTRASEEFAELLEIRTYRAYPDQGFPVRPPDPNPARRRIVALGGSSTGGAYQMDDLDQFWPKRLEERLAGTDWEVVNQGVGGWNSLHVRLYVESQLERLDADVFVLYLGHNDVLSSSPVPYRELYARWRAPSSAARAVSNHLHGLRLYVGLKYALLGLRDRSGAVAVPVADARENLAAIIAAAKSKGVKVLLATEGLNPDPLPMRDYGEMQRALAAEADSRYLDAATKLWETADPDLFLDDCHLSVSGHRQLAEWVHTSLAEAGWL